MKRVLLSLLLAALFGSCGTFEPVTPDQPPPIGPVDPPPPPIDPPPPATPPGAVTDALARIAVGATVAEASAALGLGAAEQIPGTPALARWFLVDLEGKKWMLFAVLDVNSRVERKGASAVEIIGADR